MEYVPYSEYRTNNGVLFTLVLGSHFFKVQRPTPQVQNILRELNQLYTQRGLIRENRKMVYKPIRVWGHNSFDRAEYRYHIGQLPDFYKLLERYQIKQHQFKVEVKPMFKPAKLKAKLKKDWILREEQLGAYEYLIADHEPESSNEQVASNNRMLPLQTGKGKSLISTAASITIGDRLLVLIQPRYIDKWIEDIFKYLDVTTKDIMTVQGSAQLMGIIDLAKAGNLNVDVIIVSSATLRNFIKTYEENPYDQDVGGYECTPEELCNTLKVGTVLIDEVHQEFFANYKAQTYSHVPRFISLSATLLNNDTFMERLYSTVFPRKSRFEGIALDKYIKAFPVGFRFDKPQLIRTSEFGSTTYSHTAFEKSIMRRPEVMRNYMGFVKFLVDFSYHNSYMNGDKLIIFAATIQMCTEITNYLKRQFPQYDVRRYVEDDPYENIIEPDIRVTTVISGGTAIDIPGLRSAVMLVNILSAQSNIQSFGRLRKLKDRDVKFYYAFSNQFPKHVEYHQVRRKMLDERCASVAELLYFKNI